MAILERLRNFLHWPRETEFNNGEPASAPHLPFNPVTDHFSRITGIPQDLYNRNGVRREIQRNPVGEHINVHRLGNGGICHARVETTQPIHMGELLRVNERGGVEPIPSEEMEAIVNNPLNTVVAALENAENENQFIRVRVHQGSVGLITGQSPPSLVEAEQMAEAIEAARIVSAGLHPPAGTTAEVIEQILNECAAVVQHDTLENKYDKKYPHICYACKKPLQYKHALGKAKQQGFSEEQFKKIWKSEAVEFYCCFCIPNDTRLRGNRRGWDQYGGGHPVIQTPHPEVGRDFLEIMRANMATVSRRWYLTPTSPDDIHFINQGQITGFHIENEQGEVIYRDVLPEPIMTHEFTHELLDYPQHHSIRLHVSIRGGEGQYFNGSFERVLFSPVPSEQQNITINKEFPDVTDPRKIEAIGQIYQAWLRLTPRIRINEQLPSIVNIFVDGIRNDDYLSQRVGLEQYVQTFTEAFQNWILQQMRNLAADYRERVLWRGGSIGHRYNQVHIYGGIVDGIRLEAIAEDQDDQVLNGANVFVDQIPEIINQEDLNDRANAILNDSQNGVRGLRADGIIYDEYSLEEHGHVLNGTTMNCVICGLSSVDIDAERSRQGLPGLTREELQRNAEIYRNHLAINRETQNRC